MALSDDQKAMLRLLSQRGEQGYEDIAALKGLSVEEVGTQVREAISSLEEEGIPAPAIPNPPGASADEPTSPPPPPEPEPEEQPEPSVAAPEPPAPAPVSKVAKEPTPEAARTKPPAPRKPRSGSAPKLSLPSGKGPRAAIAAAIGLVVVVVVILLVSGGSGGSSTSTETAAEAGKGGVVAVALKRAESEATSGKTPTYAALKPVEDGEGLGIAIFGKVKKALALRLVVEGLEQTSKSQSYTVWLADGPSKMLPLASTEVTEKGQINAQIELPLEVIAYLASETFDEIAVTRTEEAKLKASLNTATKAKKAPAYTGEEVLRGKVVGPVVGAQQQLEEAAEKKKKE